MPPRARRIGPTRATGNVHVRVRRGRARIRGSHARDTRPHAGAASGYGEKQLRRHPRRPRRDLRRRAAISASKPRSACDLIPEVGAARLLGCDHTHASSSAPPPRRTPASRSWASWARACVIGARERASEVCVMRSDRKYCGRGLTCEDLGHGSALPRCHAIKTKPDATNDLPSQTRPAARVGAVARDATRGGQDRLPSE